MEQKNTMPEFRDRLRELQGETTIVDFAKRIGISRQTLGFYINGDRIPDIKKLKKIAESLNVSADYLIGLTDIKTVNTNMRGACEYTGLSADAVTSLHINTIVKGETDIATFDFLSLLIAWDEFPKFVEHISKYKAKRHLISEHGTLIDDDYQEDIDYADVYRFLVQEKFLKFLDTYGKQEA